MGIIEEDEVSIAFRFANFDTYRMQCITCGHDFEKNVFNYYKRRPNKEL